MANEFKYKKVDYSKKKQKPDYDLPMLYQQSNEEMVAQQSKRDQVVTLYLAMFSFIVPYAMSMEGVSELVRGFIFLAVAIVGIMFSLILIRYRVYKEAYWICCRAITQLMNFEEEKIDKELIQSIYYDCLYANGNGFVNGDKFNHKKFFKKHIFSGETIYYIVQIFITAILTGLSMALITYMFGVYIAITAGFVSAILVFWWLLDSFFKELAKGT